MTDAKSKPDPASIYVIGDIHGRSDLLDRMIGRISADVGARGADSLTVTVGDYVDRGPDSRGVIERLIGNPFPTPYVALKGNHELLLEDFLHDPQIGLHWRRLGGLETLRSYGSAAAKSMAAQDFARAASEFAAALPDAHKQFIAGLKTSFDLPRYFICHAGVRPGIPLGQQSDDDLLWIRGEFLDSDADFGKIVVHGHTPSDEPEVKRNRINVDTGAFATGKLTCVVLEGDRHRFITA